MTPRDWENSDVRLGMRRMLELRARRIDAGERPIGWKLGFGAPSSLEKFGLTGPLVGFLTDAALHQPGSQVSVQGWTQPVAEPELAVHIGEDMSDGSGDIGGAITGIAAAIELADVDPPPQDIAEVLSGNIYHRAVITDVAATRVVPVDRLRARVVSDGEAVEVENLEELTGGLYSIIGHCADLLAAAGESLRAGDIVIAGSVVPPVRLRPGVEFEFQVAGFPSISVHV